MEQSHLISKWIIMQLMTMVLNNRDQISQKELEIEKSVTLIGLKPLLNNTTKDSQSISIEKK